MKRWLLATVFLPFLSVHADTVLLRNGAWIDGIVKLRTDTYIELQIGSIGKIILPLEDVYSIEKNNRTGADIGKTYVEPKGKTERLGLQPKVKPNTERGDTPEESSGNESSERSSEDVEKDGKGGEIPDSLPPSDVSDLNPELKERIEELVQELQRQKARNRVRAERHLKAIGQPAIPFLIPIARHESELTRIAVMRLFESFGDDQVIEIAINRLLDENEYVRNHANKTLKRISGEDFRFHANASPQRREEAYKKWKEWWEGEKELLEKDRKLSADSR